MYLSTRQQGSPWASPRGFRWTWCMGRKTSRKLSDLIPGMTKKVNYSHTTMASSKSVIKNTSVRMAGKRWCYPPMVTLASFWRMLMAYFAGSGSLNSRLANQSFISLQAVGKSQRLHHISCGLAKWGKACKKIEPAPASFTRAQSSHIPLFSPPKTASVDEATAEMFKRELLSRINMLEIIQYTLLGVGLGIFVLCLLGVCIVRRSDSVKLAWCRRGICKAQRPLSCFNTWNPCSYRFAHLLQ